MNRHFASAAPWRLLRRIVVYALAGCSLFGAFSLVPISATAEASFRTAATAAPLICGDEPAPGPHTGRPLPTGLFKFAPGDGWCRIARWARAQGFVIAPGVPVTGEYLRQINWDLAAGERTPQPGGDYRISAEAPPPSPPAKLKDTEARRLAQDAGRTAQNASTRSQIALGGMGILVAAIVIALVIALAARRRARGAKPTPKDDHADRTEPRERPGSIRQLVRSRQGRVLVTLCAAIPVVTAVGLWMLWPQGGHQGLGLQLVKAVVAADGSIWILVAAGLLLVGVWWSAGWRALGLVPSLLADMALIFAFVIPAILSGAPGFFVALTATGAMICIALLLTYGAQAPAIAAAVSVGACVLVTATVSHIVLSASRLSSGVGIAGAIIASVGGMIDVAVTQVSTVGQLHEGHPGAEIGDVRRRALKVGEDHLKSMGYTLTAAFLGGALVSLTTAAQAGTASVIDVHAIAEQFITVILLSAALTVVTPVSTGLAVRVVRHLPRGALMEAEPEVPDRAERR